MSNIQSTFALALEKMHARAENQLKSCIENLHTVQRCLVSALGELPSMDGINIDSMPVERIAQQLEDEVKKLPRWISVKRELPPEGQAVIITSNDPHSEWMEPVWLGYLRGGEWHEAEGSPISAKSPSHWMQLPEPPR